MHNNMMSIILIINNIIGLVIAVRFNNHLLIKKVINYKVRKIGQFVILSAAIIMNIIFDKLGVSLLIGFAVFFIISNVFYLGRVHIKVIATIFVVIFSFVTELLTALIFAIVFGDELQSVRENLMHLFLGGIVSKILLIMLVEVIIRFRIRNASKVSLSSWILIISIPIISIILSIISVYGPIIKNEFSSISVIFCLSIFYINMITFYLFDSIVIQVDENNQYKFREKQMLMQKDQYENIISGYNQIRKVRHDLLSHLITLDGYLKQNKKDEAVEYIHNLNSELSFSGGGIVSSNVVVDALINNRKSRAHDERIEFEVDIIIPNRLKINDMDLCIVMGNVLNNAIEACLRMKHEHEKRKISIKMRYKKASLLIEINNSYDISTIKKRYERFVSSKRYRDKDEFGTGIENVKTIIDKFGGIYQTELKEKLFVVKMMLPDIEIGSF